LQGGKTVAQLRSTRTAICRGRSRCLAAAFAGVLPFLHADYWLGRFGAGLRADSAFGDDGSRGRYLGRWLRLGAIDGVAVCQRGRAENHQG